MAKKTIKQAVLQDIFNYKRSHTFDKRLVHLLCVVLILMGGYLWHFAGEMTKQLDEKDATISQQALTINSKDVLILEKDRQIGRINVKYEELLVEKRSLESDVVTLEKEKKELDERHTFRYNNLRGEYDTAVTNLQATIASSAKLYKQRIKSLDTKLSEMLQKYADETRRSQVLQHNLDSIRQLLTTHQ